MTQPIIPTHTLTPNDHRLLMKKIFPIVNHPLYGSCKSFEELSFLLPGKLADFTNDTDFSATTTNLEICPACFFNTSGTTNRSKKIPFSDADLQRQRIHEAIALKKLGMKAGQGVMSLGAPLPSISGWAIVNGSDALGAKAINSSQLDYDTIFEMNNEEKINVVIGTPLVVKEIGLAIEQEYGALKYVFPNMDMAIIFGDVLPESMRLFIKNLWGLDKVYSLYGTVEADVVATECRDQPGRMKLMSERLYFEFIPEIELLKEKAIPNYKPLAIPIEDVKDNDIGEIVISDFSRESLPLLRYRIGDIIQVHKNTCNEDISVSVLGRAKNSVTVGKTQLYEMQVDETIQKTFGKKIIEWKLMENANIRRNYQLYFQLADNYKLTDSDISSFYKNLSNARSNAQVDEIISHIKLVQVAQIGEASVSGDAKARRIVLA